MVSCIYNAQRHPDCWDEPESFRPERFLDATIDPFAWLPFGGGARRCIGMTFALYEMRVVLATILSRLELRPGHHTPKVALRSFTFAPKGGARVTVRGPRRVRRQGSSDTNKPSTSSTLPV